MREMAPTDTLVTIGETAEILGVSIRTVHRLRSDGALTPVELFGPRRARSVRFRLGQVTALARKSSAA